MFIILYIFQESIKISGDTQKGNAEVIATLNRLGNTNELIGILQDNADLLSDAGIRFSATSGKIAFNGIPVDIIEFGKMPKDSKVNILSDIPAQSEISTVTDNTTTNQIKSSPSFLDEYIYTVGEAVLKHGVQLMTVKSPQVISSFLQDLTKPLQEKLIKATIKFCKKLDEKVPNYQKMIQKLRNGVNVFKQLIEIVLMFIPYHLRDLPLVKFCRNNFQTLELAIDFISWDSSVVMNRLIQFFIKWTMDASAEFIFEKISCNTNVNSQKIEKICKKCGGFNFVLC